MVLLRPDSSRLAMDDWEDLSAKSGGSGPLGRTPVPVLLLLFSSQGWEGWLRLGTPSSLTGAESDGRCSATQTENHRKTFIVRIKKCQHVLSHKRMHTDKHSFSHFLVTVLKNYNAVAPSADRSCIMHAPKNPVQVEGCGTRKP